MFSFSAVAQVPPLVIQPTDGSVNTERHAWIENIVAPIYG
jgi:hypothetical protein